MQGTGFRDAGTGSTRMISYNIQTSRLERPEHCLVHRCTIDAEVPQVMIVEHQGYEIDAFHPEFGRKRILKRLGERDDRRCLDAMGSEIVFAFGEGDGGRTWRACWCCRCRARRGDRVAVALGRDRWWGYLAGIARSA